MTNATMYYYTQVMTNLFKGYEDVQQITDFWDVSATISIAFLDPMCKGTIASICCTMLDLDGPRMRLYRRHKLFLMALALTCAK